MTLEHLEMTVVVFVVDVVPGVLSMPGTSSG